MANETPGPSGTNSEPENNTRTSHSIDASSNNNPTDARLEPIAEGSGGLDVPGQQRARGNSLSNRLSERVRGVLGSTEGENLTSTTSVPRITRRGTDLAEDVGDHTRTSGDRFQGGRSKTVSARGNAIPKPGMLRRVETRAREEEWARTVGLGVSPVEEAPRENNADTVGDLPRSFRRTNTNNLGGEFGSLRRRPTALTTGRARGDSVRSRVSTIQPPTRPGEAGPDPGFSLAGPGDALAANLPFVERGYAVLNPAYDQPLNARPVWGLAKPLPRVVRPGMVPSLSELNVNQQDPDLEAGEQAPAKKASRAWDLALAAARANRGRQASQVPADEENQLDLETSTSRPSVGGKQNSSESAGGVAPPSPIREENEDGLEPFPEVGSSITDIEEEPYQAALAYYDDEVHNHHTQWSVVRSRFREPLAELLAVTVQLTLGFAADLSVTTGAGESDTTAWAWGLATMVGIYIAGGISGAHLNPAISITLWIYRGFPLRKIPGYVFAQILGGFLAALIAFGLYQSSIDEFGGFDLVTGGTANDFVTSRRETWVGVPTAFFNEFVGTSFLAIAVLATGDDSNAPPGAGMNAFILGLIVTVISMAFGHNTGAACNPSRDFGPRLALLALGYGNKLFTDPYWFYGPWVATILGAIFGAALYDIAIFTGGESPINYPSYKMKRAAKKWRGRMRDRVGRAKGKIRRRTRIVKRRNDGYEEHDDKVSA